MGHLRQLRRQRLVQFPAPVPVEVGPQGRDPVQVAVALEVVEINPFPPADNQGRFFPEALHLGEGVPDMLPVPLLKSFGVVTHSLPPSPDRGRRAAPARRPPGLTATICKKTPGRKTGPYFVAVVLAGLGGGGCGEALGR